MTSNRLPPHSLEAERAAIGCAIQDATHAPELRPEWFYDLRHRTAAEALLELAANSKPIDGATLYQRLNSGGMVEASELTNQCQDAAPSPSAFGYWRSILQEQLALRRIIQTAQGAITGAEDGSEKPFELLDQFEHDVLAIRSSITNEANGEADVKQIIGELIDDYEQAHQHGAPRGLATGFYDIDRMFGGMKPGQLVIIAARPAVGKTSLALNIAERVAIDRGESVGFFSLEMSAKELIHRLACSRARVDGCVLNEGRPTQQDLTAVATAQAQIRKAPIHICDRGGMTLAQLTANARRMVQSSKIKLLIVDYLGLLRSGEKGRSRYEETTLVSNGLKLLAKELQLPVIALAQLNRDADKENRAPRLSDLRDSGAIEQDADVVALLHADEDQIGNLKQISVIIAKQRSGRTGAVKLSFHSQFTRFENWSNQEE